MDYKIGDVLAVTAPSGRTDIGVIDRRRLNPNRLVVTFCVEGILRGWTVKQVERMGTVKILRNEKQAIGEIAKLKKQIQRLAEKQKQLLVGVIRGNA